MTPIMTVVFVDAFCPKPSDQPRDAARREECLDLDEKSLTTFCLLSEEDERSDGDRLNDFMRLKRTTQNDAPGGVVSRGYLMILTHR
jgi:hypothetical protein